VELLGDAFLSLEDLARVAEKKSKKILKYVNKQINKSKLTGRFLFGLGLRRWLEDGHSRIPGITANLTGRQICVIEERTETATPLPLLVFLEYHHTPIGRQLRRHICEIYK